MLRDWNDLCKGTDWGPGARTSDPLSHPYPQQSDEWPLLAAINQLNT